MSPTTPNTVSPGVGHTPGPWPYDQTDDGKRYLIGKGLVEGPNGYEVAEVYADDCDPDEALANARLIAAAPAILEALEELWTWTRNWDAPMLEDDEFPRAKIDAAISLARSGDAVAKGEGK